MKKTKQPSMTYDSRFDTECHIRTVQNLLDICVADLFRRTTDHDKSKLEEPELSVFNEFTPKLRGSTYGSDEYKAFLAAMKPALDHHYAHNRHHPEHFPGGIKDMTLIDLIEMLCDWKAATQRHADGDIRKSLEINQKRFGYSDELKQIMLNTVVELASEEMNMNDCPDPADRLLQLAALKPNWNSY